ncbi:SDR family NAD(P)-dependent oxidoreductase [Pelagibius sp.]|uniref:SDR family NAD(P)-dependent oxidoreductase n=1 Tax=Pelagibius sp. TaxID=1931238 RepID=UPI00261EEA45|nr:SDR family oxidoreductase [Pelagibius sp.]
MAMLSGKTAFVTGGAGGIGAAICARFAKEGAEVIAADVAEPAALPEGVTWRRYDVTSEAAVRQTFDELGGLWDKLDILVNAAGIEIEKTIEDTTLEEWNRVFAINVTGMFLTAKHALPLLRKSPGASVINFGSYDGFIADPGLTAYCASKGAVHALTRAMACDHGPEGIRVNAICPGYVDTPMLQSFFRDSGDIESLQQAVRDVHPLRSYGTPDDIANLVNWLASDEARYASGQLWVIDGGLSAQVQQMRL